MKKKVKCKDCRYVTLPTKEWGTGRVIGKCVALKGLRCIPFWVGDNFTNWVALSNRHECEAFEKRPKEKDDKDS